MNIDFNAAFVAWLINTKRIDADDINSFNDHLNKLKRLREAKQFVDNNFKGMF